jgi:ferritin-like metal-binding protein YciE
MTWFTSTNLASLQTLFIDSVACLIDAEQQLVDALADISRDCTSVELRIALEEYGGDCRANAERLEGIFLELGIEPDPETAHAVAALLDEVEECASTMPADEVRDAAIIGAIQALVHYQISWYGTVRTYARYLGRYDAAEALQRNLDLAEDFDRRLTVLAESGINDQAVR